MYAHALTLQMRWLGMDEKDDSEDEEEESENEEKDDEDESPEIRVYFEEETEAETTENTKGYISNASADTPNILNYASNQTETELSRASFVSDE